jgi:hypothetical protein
VKILIVGDWHSDLHEQEVLRALTRLGHEVGEFKWHTYFSFPAEQANGLSALAKRAQNKYLVGPALWRINQDFVQHATAFQPDMVFVYRGTHITAQALHALKVAMPQCLLVGYNNDDPFAPSQPWALWRHFKSAIPRYDLLLAYRHANVLAFQAAGAKRVELLRSWYVPDRNYPTPLDEAEQARFGADVVFAGHYEPDTRLEFLEAIAERGFKLRIFGPTKYWAPVLRESRVLSHMAPIKMVWGADYNRALCGAKVALCFLSKLNRDTYTRRCFEIPATRTLMLSEYSDDLASLYTEGVEADYFRNKAELMQKIAHYVENDTDRMRVAQAGYDKVRSAGHDVDSRMETLLGLVNAMRQQVSRP